MDLQELVNWIYRSWSIGSTGVGSFESTGVFEMMNQNSNLTTVLASNAAKRQKDPGSEKGHSENSIYLEEAAEFIASKGGTAFLMVNGNRMPTRDTIRMIEVLESQAAEKLSWKSTEEHEKEQQDSTNSHIWFSPSKQSPVTQEQVEKGGLTGPIEPRKKGKVWRKQIRWGQANQTKFFQGEVPKDYTSADLPKREHNPPRSDCTWLNSHSLNISEMSVDMDISEIGVAGYFSSVQPLIGQTAKMEKAAKVGNSILRDRLLAHSKDHILRQFQFCGRYHPLREQSGQIGVSLPEPFQDYMPASRFKNQSFFITQSSNHTQFTGPICQQDDIDIYLVQVHPRNNRKVTKDLELALEEEIADTMSVSSYGSCASKADMAKFKSQSKLRISLHAAHSVPANTNNNSYTFAFALRGAPDFDGTHNNPGIASLQSWDLSQIVACTHRLLRKADCGKGTSFASRSRITMQRVEILAEIRKGTEKQQSQLTETWVIVHLHHYTDEHGNCPYTGTVEELRLFISANLAEGGVFYAAGLPLCYTEMKPDPEKHDGPFYPPLPEVFQTPAGLITIRKVHTSITVDSALTTLAESGLDLARLTHIALRRTPKDLTLLGRVPGQVLDEDYGMEIELRFQGGPPPLYDLSLNQIKNRGLIHVDAPEADTWAWSDTPGLHDLRHAVMIQAGLVPYEAALLTGLLNSSKEANTSSTATLNQLGSQSVPRDLQITQVSESTGLARLANQASGDRGRDQRGRAANRGGRGRARNPRGGRGGRFQNETSLDSIQAQLAYLLADNADLRKQLAEEKRYRIAREENLSYPTIYPGVPEGAEEYSQEEGEIELKGKAEARKDGRQGTGASSKRIKGIPPGESTRS